MLFDYDLAKQCPGKNLLNQGQIKQLTHQIKHYGEDNGLARPFIAIDYEGGAVDRLNHVEGCLKTKKPDELGNFPMKPCESEVEKWLETLQAARF